MLPQTYMNRSGASVAPACQSLGIEPGDLIVIHDEIDLAFGCLRIKVGGGHGGHNGLRSIAAELGETGYKRLRMGVGHVITSYSIHYTKLYEDAFRRDPAGCRRVDLDLGLSAETFRRLRRARGRRHSYNFV